MPESFSFKEVPFSGIEKELSNLNTKRKKITFGNVPSRF